MTIFACQKSSSGETIATKLEKETDSLITFVDQTKSELDSLIEVAAILDNATDSVSQKKINDSATSANIGKEKPVKILESSKDNIKSVFKENTDPENDSIVKTENEVEFVVELSSPDHDPFSKMLNKYVTNDGKVNYKGFKNDQQALKNHILALEQNPPKKEWSKNDQLAYWINLYNALTVNLIIENYPLESILEINNGKAWDLKLTKIQDDQYSLNDIEHQIIRKQFNEPRIHFAVNCAAVSCPKLLNEAFVPDKLAFQLEAQTKYFINNNAKNTIDQTTIEISKIFEWYAEDFGNLKTFISKYHSNMNPDNEIAYREYDWKLNQ